MSGLFKKISALGHNHTTYGVGLLQTKAYRTLKLHTDAALAPLGITSVHWACLGLLYEHSEGLRIGAVALELGVEVPFVTVLSTELITKGFVVVHKDATDSRVKILALTKKGTDFVASTEALLRKDMKELLHGASVNDILSYLVVLETIIKNSK
jgi:DNA-binding MarR family transcriptional regulator